jgi:hypothetical protein
MFQVERSCVMGFLSAHETARLKQAIEHLRFEIVPLSE